MTLSVLDLNEDRSSALPSAAIGRPVDSFQSARAPIVILDALADVGICIYARIAGAVGSWQRHPEREASLQEQAQRCISHARLPSVAAITVSGGGTT